MLTVEQVRNLDNKVRKALDLIGNLKSENSMLKGKLDEYKQRIDQLEAVVDGFKLEQLEIEEGIKDVLTQLDMLEDQITAPAPSLTESGTKSEYTEALPVSDSSEKSSTESESHVSPAIPAHVSESEQNKFSGLSGNTSKPEPVEQQPPELEIF